MMIESTGEKQTAEQRTEAAIRYCKERIEHYQEVVEALEGEISTSSTSGS